MNIPIKFLSLLKQECRPLCIQHIPYEAQYFDLVWEACWGHLNSQSFLTPESLIANDMWVRGLGEVGAIGNSDSQTLDTMYVVAALTMASADLLNRSFERIVTEKEIKQSLLDAAAKSGAPQYIRRILTDHASEILASILSRCKQGSELSASATNDNKAFERERVYIEWLKQGILCAEWFTAAGNDIFRADARSLSIEVSTREFSLIVDEPRQKLLRNDGPPTFIKQLGYGERVFLWFVLSHIGKPFTSNEVSEFIKSLGGRVESKSIPPYKSRLVDQCIGEKLSQKIFLSQGFKGYLISQNGWSMLWVRTSQARENSLILPDYKSKV